MPQATRNGSDLWLSYWVAHTEEDVRGVAPGARQPASWPTLHAAPAAPSARLPAHVHPFAPPWSSVDSQQQNGTWPAALGLGSGWGLRVAGLPPETSFFFSVLLLIAAANSFFTMVSTRSAQPSHFTVFTEHTENNVLDAPAAPALGALGH